MNQRGRNKMKQKETKPMRNASSGFMIFKQALWSGLKESGIKFDKFAIEDCNNFSKQWWDEISKENQDEFRQIATEGRKYNPPQHRHPNDLRIRTWCSPSMVLRVVEGTITCERKVQLMKRTGLISMVQLKCTGLKRCFVRYVLNRFNTVDKVIHVDGVGSFAVTYEDVGAVLGIPSRGKIIPECVSNDFEKTIHDCFHDRSIASLRSKVLGEIDDQETFMQAYVLLILGCFLCPTTKDEASVQLFPAISIAKKGHEYNWSKLVLDWLIYYLHRASGGSWTDEECIMGSWTDKLVDEWMKKLKGDMSSSTVHTDYIPAFKHPGNIDSFRKQLVVDWVTHVDNKYRANVLRAAGVAE